MTWRSRSRSARSSSSRPGSTPSVSATSSAQLVEPRLRAGSVSRQLVVQRAAPPAAARQARVAARVSSSGERVEHAALVRGAREAPLLELAAHREQRLGRGRDVFARGASPPRVGARAPVREDPPREHDVVLALGPQLGERAERLVVRAVELGLDVRLVAGRTDQRGVALRSRAAGRSRS